MQPTGLLSLLATFATLAVAQDAPWCQVFSSVSGNGGKQSSQLMYSVVIPNDGSDTVSGYDAAGNCGGGFHDNLNGHAAIITEYKCSYGPDNSACVHMIATTFGADDVGAAYDAATGGLQLPCDSQSPSTSNAYIPCPWE
ncbi:hypothetical protein GQ53DRAFT_773525 [Thozetella sp. PMI_491]|nr:hypothetical protein GQ53DRAFT_773525 [Thozetella sp. PMI_491]